MSKWPKALHSSSTEPIDKIASLWNREQEGRLRSNPKAVEPFSFSKRIKGHIASTSLIHFETDDEFVDQATEATELDSKFSGYDSGDVRNSIAVLETIDEAYQSEFLQCPGEFLAAYIPTYIRMNMTATVYPNPPEVGGVSIPLNVVRKLCLKRLQGLSVMDEEEIINMEDKDLGDLLEMVFDLGYLGDGSTWASSLVREMRDRIQIYMKVQDRDLWLEGAIGSPPFDSNVASVARVLAGRTGEEGAGTSAQSSQANGRAQNGNGVVVPLDSEQPTGDDIPPEIPGTPTQAIQGNNGGMILQPLVASENGGGNSGQGTGGEGQPPRIQLNGEVVLPQGTRVVTSTPLGNTPHIGGRFAHPAVRPQAPSGIWSQVGNMLPGPRGPGGTGPPPSGLLNPGAQEQIRNPPPPYEQH